MNHTPILPVVESAEPARLIPVVADSSREQRGTSALLATFMVVPGFAAAMLEEVGAPRAKRAKVTCFTEVAFKSKDGGRKPRPDGLILVQSGSKSWSALVEAKVGGAVLSKEQIEEYLDIARENKLDALITISNQFAALPTHHPVKVSKQKTRSTGLYHFSWLSLMSKAVLVSENSGVTDPEQAFVLNELVRYLQHDASGVSVFGGMGPAWKTVCAEVQQGVQLRKDAEHVKDSVANWHQFVRYVAIQLSVALGKPVSLHLRRAQAQDAALRLQDDVGFLIRENRLETEFDIPNAASRLLFSADFMRRTVALSMRVDAPKDRKRPAAAINWFTKQLDHQRESDLVVRAHWPRRIPSTTVSFPAALDDPKELIPPNVNELPTALEIVRVIDLAGRFRGARTFVEDAQRVVPEFYEQVGQHLTRWVPKPPRIKTTERGKDEGADPDGSRPTQKPSPGPLMVIHQPGEER